MECEHNLHIMLFLLHLNRYEQLDLNEWIVLSLFLFRRIQHSINEDILKGHIVLHNWPQAGLNCGK